MKRKPTLAGCIAVIVIAIGFLLAGWIEGWPYAGQRGNWVSDCDLNETCRTVPFNQRDGSSYTGICVPKEW